MPVLVDGNNVMYRLPGGSRTREALRRRVLDLSKRSRMTIEVVFDGPPPPGSPEVERLGTVTVRYSEGRTADDLIVARIPGGGAARQWTVVTDDRALASRVKSTGARVEPVASFLGRTALDRATGKPAGPELSAEELEEWLRVFGADSS